MLSVILGAYFFCQTTEPTKFSSPKIIIRETAQIADLAIINTEINQCAVLAEQVSR